MAQISREADSPKSKEFSYEIDFYLRNFYLGKDHNTNFQKLDQEEQQEKQFDEENSVEQDNLENIYAFDQEKEDANQDDEKDT